MGSWGVGRRTRTLWAETGTRSCRQGGREVGQEAGRGNCDGSAKRLGLGVRVWGETGSGGKLGKIRQKGRLGLAYQGDWDQN